jgi:2-polyprenyl-6-methoxyphenol hydroxylase-like FAD-dependent oxidoreductase
MNRNVDTSVLVVGAGPVGLTLAMDLASRGVNVTVTEIREAGEPPNVKCNQVSARSMEIFRRLGIAAKIRNTGLPAEYRNDVSCCVSATGPELSRIRLPSRAGRLGGEAGDDSWWPTAVTSWAATVAGRPFAALLVPSLPGLRNTSACSRLIFVRRR